MGLLAGTRLGPYEILSLLGAGGMGEVYRARDTRLGRDVAVKVLPEVVAADAKALARFENEARAVAALSHTNILAIYDVGRKGSTSFVVTELLEGETLRETLARGPVAPKKAVDVAIQMAEGLATAHEKGIIHRDVKPENVFLTKDGGVKLLDFGLARHDVSHHDPSDTRSLTLPALSEGGAVVGTVSYMSPEQARGEAVDYRSDQFSFGTALYEMLAGKRPFRGTSSAETMAAIIRDEPEPLMTPHTTLPPPLSWVIHRCLSKDPEGRYSSTRDLAKELQGLQSHLSETLGAVGVKTEKPSGPARKYLAAALVGTAALAAAFGLFLRTRSARIPVSTDSPIRLSLLFPPEVSPRFTGNFNPLALSPDGKTLVYAGSSLFIRPLDRDEIKPIPGTGGAVSPFFSPDGRWVGFFADGKLKKVALDGGFPITLCDIRTPRGASYGSGSWAEDETIVFMPSYYSGLQRIKATGGEPRAVTTPGASGLESHHFPQVLPGGEHVLFERDTVGQDSLPSAVVVSLRSGVQKVVAEDAAYPLYLAPGLLAFTRRGSLLVTSFDLDRLEASGPAVPVLQDLVTNRRYTNAAYMSVSSNGTLVYQSKPSFQRTLVWVDRTGLIEPLPFPGSLYTEAILSPDGTRLAVLAEEKDESIALLVGDLTRGTLTRPPTEGSFQRLVWTPDGKRIALDTAATGLDTGRLEWLPADGSAPPEPLTSGAAPQHETPTSFSPDGKILLFDLLKVAGPHSTDTGWDIYRLSLTGARTAAPVIQTRFDEMNAHFSPDGRWIAFESNESGRYEVFVRPFSDPSPKWRVSTTGGTEPRWSRDGRELCYRNGESLIVVGIDRTPTFRPDRARLLFKGPFLESYDLAPNGTRFLMIRSDPGESAPQPLSVVLNWMGELRRRVSGSK